MYMQAFLLAFTALVFLELVSDLLAKTRLWLSRQCFGAFWRLWKESIFLHEVLRNDRFDQWRPETARYIVLRAIKAQSTDQQAPQPVLGLLESTLKRCEPVVLLGEPGAGKTTSLEALTYRLARRAYRYSILLWFFLLIVAELLLVASPVLSLLWLISFFLWESFARCSTLPLFLEARYEYEGGAVKDWRDKTLKEHLGEKPLFGWRNRVAFLVDGVNEVQASVYGTFIEGWRGFLRDRCHTRVIFASRVGENPAPRLQLNNVLTICDLDGEGVHQFLGVYGREKAATEGKPYPPEQVERDFEELDQKNLLGEKDIGRNPYWLKMIVESGLYTRNRGVLFRSFTEELIRREIIEKPEERVRRPEWKIVPLEVEMDALGRLALAMHQRGHVGFAGAEGWKRARTVLREGLGDLAFTPNDILGEAEAATLVREQYKGRVEFTHQLVQEFFTAYALHTEENWELAISHAEDVWWWPTLFLLGGLVGVEESSPAFSKLALGVLGDGQNEQRLFAALGLLYSIENTPFELSQVVLGTFIASIGESLTEGQQRAAQELVRILGDEAVESFGVLFHDPEYRTSRKGAALLCAVGGKRATELLIDALRDLNRRKTTTEILTSVGRPAVVPLITALKVSDWDIRMLAVDTLAKIGAPAVEPLISALSDSVWDVRVHVADALAKICVSAVEPLITALSHPNQFVRATSLNALIKIGDPRILSNLERIALDLEGEIGLGVREAIDAIRRKMAQSWICIVLIGTANQETSGLIREGLLEGAEQLLIEYSEYLRMIEGQYVRRQEEGRLQAEFTDPGQAIRAAIRVLKYTSTLPGGQSGEIRIGLDAAPVSDVPDTDNDIEPSSDYDRGVARTTRIMEICPSGHILCSHDLLDLLKKPERDSLEAHGPLFVKLKSFVRPIPVFFIGQVPQEEFKVWQATDLHVARHVGRGLTWFGGRVSEYIAAKWVAAGWRFRNIGRYPWAKGWFYVMNTLGRWLRWLRLEYHSPVGLSDMTMLLRQHEEALLWAKHTSELAHRIGNEFPGTMAEYQVGHRLAHHHPTEEAAQHLGRSYAKFEELVDTRMAGWSALYLGRCLRGLGRTIEAEYWTLVSLILASKIHHVRQVSYALVQLTRLRAVRGRFADVRWYSDLAQQLYPDAVIQAPDDASWEPPLHSILREAATLDDTDQPSGPDPVRQLVETVLAYLEPRG